MAAAASSSSLRISQHSISSSFDDDRLSSTYTASIADANGVSGSPTLTRDLAVDLHNARAITKADLQETARALAKVFNDNEIPYAFCGGYEMIQFNVKDRITNVRTPKTLFIS